MHNSGGSPRKAPKQLHLLFDRRLDIPYDVAPIFDVAIDVGLKCRGRFIGDNFGTAFSQFLMDFRVAHGL